MKKPVYIMPFSHLDLFWLGSQEECLSRGNRVISEALRIAKEREDFCFLLEDVIFVKHFTDSHAEKIEDLKALIKEGKIEVGPKWAGIHQNFQSGEDLVRNTLYAKQFLRETLAVDTKTIHLGDLPAYTPQFPQILLKSDVSYAIMTRGGPRRIPLYYWQSPDGSKVLTWYTVKTYAVGKDLKLHKSIEEDALKREVDEISSLTPAPILMHWGIDLILPTEKLCENIKKWNETHNMELKIVTPTQYFEEVKDTSDLPVLSGEVPSVWAPLDAQAPHIAVLDIPATNTLLTAEKFATIVSALGWTEYPEIQLKETWQRLLQAMDHNYDGQGGVYGDKRKIEYHEMAILTGEEIIRNSLSLIAENIEVRHGPECNPIVVFNPLSWSRNDIAQAHVTFHGNIEAFDIAKFRNVVLKDEEGKEVPFQYIDVREGIARGVTILFQAKDVPSIGYRTFYLVPSEKTACYEKTCQVSEIEETANDWFPLRKEIMRIENEYFIIYLNKTTGTLDITDKKTNRPLARGVKLCAVEERAGNYGFRGETTGRIFGISVDEIVVSENGPLRTRVVIRGKISESVVTQEVLLYKDLCKIDLVNTIEWEGHRPLRLQQVFPVQVENPQINYGIPYGVNSYENIQPGTGPQGKDEIPEDIWKCSRAIQKWIDVSGPSFGVTITSNYRFLEIEGSEVKFNLLRGTETPFSCIIREGQQPEYEWRVPKGTYTSRFSLIPHKGDWKKAKSYHRGWEFVNPLICVPVSDPVAEKKLPPSKSFCSISSDNTVITVLKKGEKDERPILRCYETEGKAAEARISFFKALKGIEETNLLEENAKPLNGLVSQIRAYEIKTLRLDV